MLQPDTNSQIPSTAMQGPEEVSEIPQLSTHNLLNNQQAHEKLDREFEVARSSGKNLSVLTGDLNALKALNDELGHDEGDVVISVLEEVFGVMQQTLRIEEDPNGRPADSVSLSAIDYSPFEAIRGMVKDAAAARVGGDEFHLILPDTDEAGAKAVAERLREVISKHLAGPHGKKYRDMGINVGLSIGTATLSPEMQTSSDLLRLSDQRMYKDKLRQLRPLTPEQIEHLKAGLEHMLKAEVRPRDLPRYIEWLGAMGIEHALSTKLDELPSV